MTEAPFSFSCRRSGRCCSQGLGGRVWLTPDDVTRLAKHFALPEATFRERHTFVDGGRTSLRMDQGRCTFLEGTNQCTVYEARPAQCSSWPYWDQVLTRPEGLERAMAICPGIEPPVDDEARQRAFARLRNVYAMVERELRAADPSPICELSGVCCDFERVDHELWASRLETDFADSFDVERSEESARAPTERTLCPFWIQGRCANREGRPLGCRVYFCDPAWKERGEALYEKAYREIQAIAEEYRYPWSYGRFVSSLPRRPVDRPSSAADEASCSPGPIHES